MDPQQTEKDCGNHGLLAYKLYRLASSAATTHIVAPTYLQHVQHGLFGREQYRQLVSRGIRRHGLRLTVETMLGVQAVGSEFLGENVVNKGIEKAHVVGAFPTNHEKNGVPRSPPVLLLGVVALRPSVGVRIARVVEMMIHELIGVEARSAGVVALLLLGMLLLLFVLFGVRFAAAAAADLSRRVVTPNRRQQVRDRDVIVAAAEAGNDKPHKHQESKGSRHAEGPWGMLACGGCGGWRRYESQHANPLLLGEIMLVLDATIIDS